MSCPSSHSLESLERSWHVDTSNCDDITWSTFPSIDSFSNAFQSPWHMTDRDLITRFLNLDFLKADELARLDLHHKLTLGLVCHTSSALAFN